MKAAIYETYQGAITIQNVKEPTPKKHGVVILVKATGMCRSDWHVQMGHDKDMNDSGEENTQKDWLHQRCDPNLRHDHEHQRNGDGHTQECGVYRHVRQVNPDQQGQPEG